ncbi:hypothetical protein Tco_0953928 [Tanacetum coccineum]|uniref:Uncharacterized protein n=1 Tax=Tanacetum coccineum TaxID=301880 RepID=A0ABQ5E318_9ASTR
MGAKSAWFQEKYSGSTHGGIGCSSSQANCPLNEKELHQLRMDEEGLKEILEEEAMNKKAQEEKVRQEQAKSDAFFLEFRVGLIVIAFAGHDCAGDISIGILWLFISWEGSRPVAVVKVNSSSDATVAAVATFPCNATTTTRRYPFHDLVVRLMVLFVSRVYEVWARTNEHELLVFNQVCDAPISEKWVAAVHLGLLGHAHANAFDHDMFRVFTKSFGSLCVYTHDTLLTKVAYTLCKVEAFTNETTRFEVSCAVRDDLRKAYEKCNDISQGSRALICTLLKESSEKDHKLHLSMYGKAAQLEKQMGAKSAWFQEKYSGRTHGGIGCSSSQANCPLTEKELHQLRRDEEALKEMLEEEAMNKKAQEEKVRQEQSESDALFLEFGVVRYDSEYGSLG